MTIRVQPPSVGSGIVNYRGTWNALTNTPTLSDGAGANGDFYKVSTGAARNLGSVAITYAVGDYVLYDGAQWGKVVGPGGVTSVDGLAGAVALSNRYGRGIAQAGIVAPTIAPASVVASALSVGVAYVVRFVPSRDMTVTSMSFVVTTAASTDDACDVGIYSAAMALLVSAGAQPGKLNSVGVKNTPVAATALTAGTVYYAAMSVPSPFGGTAAQVAMASLSNAAVADIFGAADGIRTLGFKGASHPLPASLVGTSPFQVGPLLAVRE